MLRLLHTERPAAAAAYRPNQHPFPSHIHNDGSIEIGSEELSHCSSEASNRRRRWVAVAILPASGDDSDLRGESLQEAAGTGCRRAVVRYLKYVHLDRRTARIEHTFCWCFDVAREQHPELFQPRQEHDRTIVLRGGAERPQFGG